MWRRTVERMFKKRLNRKNDKEATDSYELLA